MLSITIETNASDFTCVWFTLCQKLGIFTLVYLKGKITQTLCYAFVLVIYKSLLDLVHWNYVILRPNNIDLSRDRGGELPYKSDGLIWGV